jgi:hypothetical protein
LREYFYRIPQREGSTGQQTLYQVLQVPCTASPGELRVAFKLRQLELEAKHCPRSEYVLLECAFNILGDPGLRACYDVLLKDPEAPAIFPYGGFGSLLVSGDRVWVERKQIPHLRVMGRNIRFLKSDLEPFRASFRQEMVNA